MYGNSGTNFLIGGQAKDTINGGTGTDFIEYNKEDGVVDGGDGIDMVKIFFCTPLNSLDKVS